MNKQKEHKSAQTNSFQIDKNLFNSLMTETTNEVSKVKRFNEHEKSFFIENVKFNIFSDLSMKSKFISNQRKVELSDFSKQLYFILLIYCDYQQNNIDYDNSKNTNIDVDQNLINKLSINILSNVLMQMINIKKK